MNPSNRKSIPNRPKLVLRGSVLSPFLHTPRLVPCVFMRWPPGLPTRVWQNKCAFSTLLLLKSEKAAFSETPPVVPPASLCDWVSSPPLMQPQEGMRWDVKRLTGYWWGAASPEAHRLRRRKARTQRESDSVIQRSLRIDLSPGWPRWVTVPPTGLLLTAPRHYTHVVFEFSQSNIHFITDLLSGLRVLPVLRSQEHSYNECIFAHEKLVLPKWVCVIQPKVIKQMF